MIISVDTDSPEDISRAITLLSQAVRARNGDSRDQAVAHPHLRQEIGNGQADRWQDLIALDPEFFDAAERLFGYPSERRALSTKDRALIEVALDALVTQIHPQRLQHSVSRAAQFGATRDEVLCVVEITAVVGLHSCSVAMPILFAELPAEDLQSPLTAQQAAAARRFETSGPRPRPVDGMYGSILRLDAEYFERFTQYLDVPWREGVLDHRMKQLVCIAIDVACTHLYADGIRRHCQEALAVGVTPAEILEVIQIASATGLRTMKAAVPIVMAIFGKPGDGGDHRESLA